jgi:hypothetical protein
MNRSIQLLLDHYSQVQERAHEAEDDKERR